jgi:uncharacterized protein Smg (DUF494 family)
MFSKLEKDDKSYNIIMSYIEYFMNSSNIEKQLFDFDNEIQKSEIEAHLNRNGFRKNDQYEICNWITKNGKAYRNYLNACKFLASMIEMRILDTIVFLNEVDRAYVDHLIDLYDDRIQCFIDMAY